MPLFQADALCQKKSDIINFMRSYRASRGRKRALEELPESVRGMIGELAAQKTLPPEQRRDENASGE